LKISQDKYYNHIFAKMSFYIRRFTRKELIKSARYFTNFFTADKNRSFSVITRNSIEYKEALVGVYKDRDLENNQDLKIITNVTKMKRKIHIQDDFSLRQDKTFLKFLTWINLESKDKESISIARLIAYNIFTQLKNEKLSDDVIRGIVKGLHLILKYFTCNKKIISDNNSLIQKA